MNIQLPVQAEQIAFNVRRWHEVIADPDLARVEGRIETDRHGHIIVCELSSVKHGRFQSRIAQLLQSLMEQGESITECPISTADGVRAADVAWASPERISQLGNRVCFPNAPGICVEILSPANSKGEILEKKALYFDAGAKEVWVCSQVGSMTFFASGPSQALGRSTLCPKFPKSVRL